MSWRKIPPVLLLGLAIEILYGSIRLVKVMASDPQFLLSRTWNQMESGTGIAVALLVIVGAVELARRSTGPAAVGSWIIAAAHLGQFLLYVGWTVFGYIVESHAHGDWFFDVFACLQYAQSIIILVTAIGCGLASGRRGLAIALPIIAVFAVPLPVLGRWMYGSGLDGPNAGVDGWAPLDGLITFGPQPVMAGLWLVCIAFASKQLGPPPTARADVAFERAARMLWLKIIAAVSIAGVMVVGGLANGGLLPLLQLTSVAVPVVNLIALAGFAIAAIGLSRAGMSPWITACAAAASLWCLGVLVSDLPHVIRLAYGGERDVSMLGMFSERRAATFTPFMESGVQLVACASITLVLVAIAQLARRRGLDELRENASVRTGVFVVLALGSLFITRYGIAKVPEGSGILMFALLGAVGAMIYAHVIAARLCQQAATVVGSDPVGFPSATVIKGA